jgi:pimeloyl-ACP methyl ester carboxylesterase
MTLGDDVFIEVGTARLEYRVVGPRPESGAIFVLLHEGLGSAGLWGDFPDRLATATGLGVFAYSRAGYGRSSPGQLPRRASFMHEEAQVLARVLDVIGFRRGVLLGHSDGASIAAIYAGSHEDHRVLGLALIAPHFFVEDCTVAEITRMRSAYEASDLRAKLARSHQDPDNAFRSWSEPWLDPEFRKWNLAEELGYIRVPTLIIQGERDQYGTLRQIEMATQECYSPVDAVILPGVRHMPHREAPAATLRAIVDFTHRLQAT